VPDPSEVWIRASCFAWKPDSDDGLPVIDAVGAGDTFIAGMLFSLTNNATATLRTHLEFATKIASKKVYQEGFQGLGEAMLLENPRKWTQVIDAEFEYGR
jgi:ketohexokinase